MREIKYNTNEKISFHNITIGVKFLNDIIFNYVDREKKYIYHVENGIYKKIMKMFIRKALSLFFPDDE